MLLTTPTTNTNTTLTVAGRAFPASLPDNHLVFASDSGPVLIDSGSPISHVRGADGHGQGASWIDFASVSRLIGVELVGIAGNDLLARTSFTFRRAAGEAGRAGGEVRFGRPAGGRQRRARLTIPFLRASTLPITPITLASQKVQAIIDTGAVISFAPSGWLERYGGRPIGVRHEFFHGVEGFAEFDTPVWAVPAVVGGQPVTLRVGRVPAHVGDVTFILGNDVLLSGETLTYDAEQSYFAIS